MDLNIHLPKNPNLTNRHHPTSPFTRSRRYSSHCATACVCSLPELTTPDGDWTELRQNEQREEVKKKPGNVSNQQKMGSGDGTNAHAPAISIRATARYFENRTRHSLGICIGWLGRERTSRVGPNILVIQSGPFSNRDQSYILPSADDTNSFNVYSQKNYLSEQKP
ncbi:LOW QUALITY PROTEIN: hypothetical protein YC2023_118451 [Brassica napus]